jgi:hypothetical protein
MFKLQISTEKAGPDQQKGYIVKSFGGPIQVGRVSNTTTPHNYI